MKHSLIDSCLSDSIIRFQKLYKQCRDSEECKQMRDHLIHEILIISYFLPQTDFDMKEEDASEFILYLKPYVESIILSFQGGDLTSYISKTLKHRLTSFYRSKTREARAQSVAEIESGIEMLYDSEQRYRTELDEQVLSDNKSTSVKLLRAVFADNSIVRRRFFIFLASLCPFVSEPDLALICKDLSINYRETIGLRKYLIAISEADKTIAALKASEERRNNNFSLALINEIKAEIKQKEGLLEEAQEYQAKAEHRKLLVEKSLLKNRKLSLGLGPKLLSTVFNESSGTIANDLCLTKRLLSWCLSPCSYSSSIMVDLRINRKFSLLAIQSDKKTKLEMFSPYKEFNICEDYYRFKENGYKFPSAHAKKESAQAEI